MSDGDQSGGRTLLRFMCSGEEHSSPLYVQWSSAIFSALCGAEKHTLLCFMCSGVEHSSPLSSTLFSALCAVEQHTLLRFVCSEVEHSSPLCVQWRRALQWSRALFSSLCAAE